jgi:hypothetical protein
MKLKQFIPTPSAWAHLRFVFSVFLLPVYLFAFSQVPFVKTGQACSYFLSGTFWLSRPVMAITAILIRMKIALAC